MKKVILSLFSLFIAFNSIAQNCKFDYDKEDKITNKPVRYVFTKQNYKAATFGNADSIFYINLSFIVNGQRREIFQIGDELLIKLKSGKVIKIYCLANAAPVSQINTNGVFTSYLVSYKVPKNILSELKESPITLFRVSSGEISVDLEFKEKAMEKFRATAACFDQN